jgi:hypothetical protein
MTAQVEGSRHPVVDTVVDLRSDLSDLSRTPVWGLSAADTEAALVEATRLITQAEQLRLRLLAHAERVDVGDRVGATSPANWLANETRTTRAAAHRASRLATSLDEAHPAVDEALATAAINVEQATVIVDAVDELPDTIGANTVAEAEAFLLAEAADHDAKALRVLGRRLLEVLDPEAAEAEEARRLAAEEAEARAKASFTMSDDGHGKVHGRFTIPSAHGSMLRKALLAIAAPSRNPDRPANTPTRHAMGLAFLEYLETRPESSLPSAGGVSATVVVTMTLESLMGGLQSAGLCDGSRISAGEARRLACRAGVIPVILGGKSQPLDIGRKGRFHTKPQRIALGLRDGGCTAVGCDRPPSHCHAHHETPWSHGGSTSVKEGRLLCSRHHTLAHDPTYTATIRPDNKVSFHRRC